MRNNIAHNLTSLISLNDETKESEILFANQRITRTQYKTELQEWAELSLEMAKFVLNVYSKVNVDKNHAFFAYCKVEGDCVLVQHNLIYPELKGEYVSFFRNGFNIDLLDYLNNEVAYNKEKSEQ